MPLDTINDGGISSKNTDQIPTRALPDEDVAVITSCCDVVISVADEDGFLDVCVCVAVAAEPSGVVAHRLAGHIWCVQVSASAIGSVTVACTSIRSGEVRVCMNTCVDRK